VRIGQDPAAADMKLADEGKIGILEPKTYLTPVTVPVQNRRLVFPVKKRNFRILLGE
jgi:hypothetical protein